MTKVYVHTFILNKDSIMEDMMIIAQDEKLSSYAKCLFFFLEGQTIFNQEPEQKDLLEAYQVILNLMVQFTQINIAFFTSILDKNKISDVLTGWQQELKDQGYFDFKIMDKENLKEYDEKRSLKNQDAHSKGLMDTIFGGKNNTEVKPDEQEIH